MNKLILPSLVFSLPTFSLAYAFLHNKCYSNKSINKILKNDIFYNNEI